MNGIVTEWVGRGESLSIGLTISPSEDFPDSSVGKNPPAMQETLVQEDPVEKGYTTHSSILGLPWWLSW